MSMQNGNIEQKMKAKKEESSEEDESEDESEDDDSEEEDDSVEESEEEEEGESEQDSLKIKPKYSKPSSDMKIYDTVKFKLQQLEKEKEKVQKAETKDSSSEEEMDFENYELKEPSYSEENHESGQLKWKDNLAQKAQEAFLRRQQETPNLRRLVYGEVAEDEEEEDDSIGEGLFKKVASKDEDGKDSRTQKNGLDCSKFPVEKFQEWDLDEVS